MRTHPEPCDATSAVRLAPEGSGRTLHAHTCNGHHDIGRGAHFCPTCRIWWWRS